MIKRKLKRNELNELCDQFNATLQLLRETTRQQQITDSEWLRGVLPHAVSWCRLMAVCEPHREEFPDWYDRMLRLGEMWRDVLSLFHPDAEQLLAAIETDAVPYLKGGEK